MSNEQPHSPTVSIIIPAYNASEFIGDALESVFSQTYARYEVIVVNDGSKDSDQLRLVLDQFRSRMTYLEQQNRGPSAARNAGIETARGEFLAFLDSDDSWLPNYLEEQINFLEGQHHYDMVYSDALLFGPGRLAGRTFMECAPSRGDVTFESLLRYESSIITSCTVVRRRSVIEAGMFDERFIRCEDFDLWIRLAHRGSRIGFQTKVLGKHRSHDESLAANQIAMVESQMEVLRKAAMILPLTKSQQQLVERQLANCEAQIALETGKQQFAAREYSQAARSIESANQFYNSRKLQMVIFALRSAPWTLRSLDTARKNLGKFSRSV